MFMLAKNIVGRTTLPCFYIGAHSSCFSELFCSRFIITLGFLPFPFLLWVLHDNLQELAAHSERRKGGSMDISGPRRFKTPQNSTRRPPKREKKERRAGEGKKNDFFLGTLSNPNLRGSHFFWVWALFESPPLPCVAPPSSAPP